jgi:hypothetical protein
MTRRRRRRVIIQRVPAWTPTNAFEAVLLVLFVGAALLLALVIL